MLALRTTTHGGHEGALKFIKTPPCFKSTTAAHIDRSAKTEKYVARRKFALDMIYGHLWRRRAGGGQRIKVHFK